MARLAPFREVMKLDYPEAQDGDWRIERKTIEPDAIEARLGQLRAIIHGSGRWVPPGTYIGLRHGRTLVMSDTPDEMRDHSEPYFEASRRGGRVLLHGLGLGMVLRAVLSLPNVEHVDVVEIAPEVIRLVGPHFAGALADGRLTIHEGDCFTMRWPAGTRWQVVWHDVWNTLCEDNLPEMHRLHRSFGQRCDWQGSWGRSFIERWR